MSTETVTKPVWTRCKGSGTGESNGCGQRVYNSPVDIERHRQHCPADLEREVAGLARDLSDALDRIEALENVEPATVEQIDLDGVAEWPGVDDDEDSFETPTAQPAPEPVAAAAHVNASTYFADDDPDDDLA